MSGHGGGTEPAWRRRCDVGLRVLAAIPVGYAAASLWGMVLARVLPGRESEVSIIGQLMAFVLCAGFAMWAFAAPSGWRALWTLVAAGSVAGAIVWISLANGARL